MGGLRHCHAACDGSFTSSCAPCQGSSGMVTVGQDPFLILLEILLLH